MQLHFKSVPKKAQIPANIFSYCCLHEIHFDQAPWNKRGILWACHKFVPCIHGKGVCYEPIEHLRSPLPSPPTIFSCRKKKMLTECQKTHNFSNFPFEFQLNIFKLFYLSFKSCNASMGNHYVHVACTIYMCNHYYYF